MSELKCSGEVPGEGPSRKLPKKWLCMAVMVFSVVTPWLCQTIEVWCQTTPQVQIQDPGPGINTAPAATDSTRRLLELVSKQQWSETAKLAQELVRQQPTDPEVSYYLGMALVHLEEPVAAIRALRTAERLGMNSAAFHQALGIAYYNMHQFILFQQQMEKSMTLAPADYKPYYYVGRYFESIHGDFPTALRYFSKATALNPEYAASWYYEGYCFEASGKPLEARGAFETAVKIVERTQERFSLPYQGIARLLTYDDPAQALGFARKAVELEPNLDPNHVILAKIYEKLDRLSEATEELQAAERLAPTNAPARFMLARIYSKVGNREASQAEIAMFNKLNRVYGPQ